MKIAAYTTSTAPKRLARVRWSIRSTSGASTYENAHAAPKMMSTSATRPRASHTTGNTAASAAAYAARGGLRCAVVLPAGHVALGKLSQAIAFGARVVAVRGSFDDALALSRELATGGQATLVNSVNPYRIDGQKTAAFEICETLGDAPDWLCIPVGNAGNITAYWKGFTEARDAKMARRRPQMYGFQAAGAAPIVNGEVVADPQTIATAIRIGNPASWNS